MEYDKKIFSENLKKQAAIALYFNEKQIQNEKVKIIGKAVESRKKL